MSSLLSSWNLLSSRSLVKISMSYSFILTWEISVSLDGIISQKLVSDINVFGSKMLIRIVSNLEVLSLSHRRGTWFKV
jgi:hypothetical protein